MKKSIGVILIFAAILVGGAVGYVKNIINVTKCDFEPSYKAEVIGIIGIVVPPVGAIVGYIDLGK